MRWEGIRVAEQVSAEKRGYHQTLTLAYNCSSGCDFEALRNLSFCEIAEFLYLSPRFAAT